MLPSSIRGRYTGLAPFDLRKQLAALCLAIADKRADVLRKAFDRLFHLRIELSCSFEARFQITQSLCCSTVFACNRVSLTGKHFILVLLRSDSLVL